MALSGASTTTAVTLGTQGYTNGKIRVKVYNGGSSTNQCRVTVTVSDGTNTYLVGPRSRPTPSPTVPTAASTCSGYERWISQIATVNIITALTVGTTTASLDYEICLNP